MATGDTGEKTEVRLGIVGLGRVFWLGYLPWLRSYLAENPQVRLAAVCDLDERLCLKHAKSFSCGYYTNAHELLEDDGIDAVIINTPTWTHEELVVGAAAAGKHVLCEKPMAATVDACDRMLDACRDSDVLLFISFMRRFNLGFQKVMELAKKGVLGELIELDVNWPYFIPDIDTEPYAGALEQIKRFSGVDIPEKYGAWRLKDKRVGGGDFLDHGPHIIDFFRWIAGDITHVSGDSCALVPDRNEDYTKCVLKFRSGATGFITTTLYDFRSGLVGKVYGTVRGTEGRVDFVLPNTDKFKPIRYVTLYREPPSKAGKIVRALGLNRGRRIRLPQNRVFADQLDYFVCEMQGRRRHHPVFADENIAATGEDGRYTIKVVELCYRAAQSSPSWLPME